MSSTDVPGVACSAVSGSQVCSGTMGALMAKAMKKVVKIHRLVAAGMSRFPARRSMRRASCPPGP